jgi:hypothetical protein
MRAEFHARPESGVPPGRGPSSYAIQAINCLATIVKSLRDKKPTQLLRSSAKSAPTGFSLGLRVARNQPSLSAVVSGKMGRRRKSGGPGSSLGCSACYSTAAPNIGCHFQGTFYYPPDPGLKPWAVLYSRFAAKLRRVPSGRAGARPYRPLFLILSQNAGELVFP